ncbi:hypothetical protein E2P81_ATG11214 [Venturia nashicola]|nr:hypothetical protein E2P81_ATG11214 [Venturia nashicola]
MNTTARPSSYNFSIGFIGVYLSRISISTRPSMLKQAFQIAEDERKPATDQKSGTARGDLKNPHTTLNAIPPPWLFTAIQHSERIPEISAQEKRPD